jgi:hypothetical protein
MFVNETFVSSNKWRDERKGVVIGLNDWSSVYVS